ncbi:MAG: GNAT family N-acetyltransferase [Pseudomonadota bacterium]
MSTPLQNVVLDTAQAGEIPTILGWAADEGWNPGLEDSEAFYAADPGGFFVARAGEGPVAAISLVRHGAEFAFLGLYLCKPSWRGQGIGYALWTHAMAGVGPRTVGLDGVPDQQENYRKSGFVTTGGTQRFTGEVPGMDEEAIKPADPSDIPTLCAREAAAMGYAKPAFCQAWFRRTDTRETLVLGDSFATLRTCKTGAKIGPLVAQDETAARRLIQACAARRPGPLTVDVPQDCAALAALCEGFGMTCGFTTARMYRGAPPSPPGAPLRAIATLELG